jgi:hypothetical protein
MGTYRSDANIKSRGEAEHTCFAGLLMKAKRSET